MLETLMGKEIEYDDDPDDGHLRKSKQKDILDDQGRYTRDAYEEEDEARLDEAFHKLIGIPHRSEREDEMLAELEMNKLGKEGKIKKEDVDLAVAIETLDNLMNTAENLSRKQRSTSLNDEEIFESLKDSITSVKKAADTLPSNKAISSKLLEKAKYNLLNIAKAVNEKKASDDIDEKLRKAMKSELMLDELIEKMGKDSSYKRSKRSKNSLNHPSEGKTTINDMLNEYYKAKDVIKIPSKSVRHSRSVKNSGADDDFASAFAVAKKLDKMMGGFYEDPENAEESINLRNKRNSRSVLKEKFSQDSKADLVTEGLSEDQYNWLLDEFDLTMEDVESVKALTENEFSALQNSLRKASVTPEKDYTIDDLVAVLRSARQLVPSELEAAAYGAMHMGRHLGGRAIVAVDPVVSVIRDSMLPAARKMVGQAVDSVPDDVEDWAGEGRRIATERAQLVAEYAGPRLARLGKSMDQLQGQLRETAGDALSELVPQIVPALKLVVDELRDTLDLAREYIPPMVQKVGEQTSPVYRQVKDTMTEQVMQPVYEYVIQPAVDTAQPAYQAVSPLGRAAYHKVTEGGKVVYDEVTPVLGDLATSSGDLLRQQVMPAMEHIGHGASYQAGRVGNTIKTSVAPTVRDVLKSTLNTVFTRVPKMIQQLSHEAHDAAKVFRGGYTAALGKMRSRQEKEEERGGSASGFDVTSVAPPVFRPTKAPKRTYVTSTEL